jgi:acetyltransferase-like isoleucine patch superfamily enzyme
MTFSDVTRVLKKDFQLAAIRETIFLGLANLLPRSNTSDAMRAIILKLAGMKIQYPVQIRAPVEIRPIGASSRISIGRDTFINSYARFTARYPASVQIGERVLVGPNCMFETVNHELELNPQGQRRAVPASIVVEDDVWLGARVIVLPGVTIGKGSTVAAGAVVTADVPSNVVVAGIPAGIIRHITP